MQKQLVRDDLIFHSAYGLCKVSEIIKENRSGEEILCYVIVPKVSSRSSVRFIVPVSTMEISSFHTLISPEEANEIIEYIKKGIDDPSFKETGENHPWNLAKELLYLSGSKADIKDQKKRQTVKRSVKGLVEELALVSKTTFEEMAVKIQKYLGNISTINTIILQALELEYRK